MDHFSDTSSSTDVDFNIINKLAKDSLTKNLNSVDKISILNQKGIKNLVVDAELLKPIDRLIRYSELKKYDVEKVFKLEETLHKSRDDAHIQWIYIVRPNIKHLKYIAKHINEDLKLFNRKAKYKILFSPKKLYICEFILEQEGVYEYVNFGELELDLIQLDTDILSMEYRDFFKNYYLHGDQTWLTSVARSLITIEGLYGKIPNIHLHGNCARSVFRLMERLTETSKTYHKDFKYEIGNLILIDRSTTAGFAVDYITPFCSSLTYEGLLDEVYQINAGLIDIPTDAKNPNALKRCKLSNEDQTFKEIRYLHFSDVFTHLRTLVRTMQERKEELENKDKSAKSTEISRMKEFVQNELRQLLQNKESVQIHLQASEILLNEKTQLDIATYLGIEHNILLGKEYKKSYEYIEELINRKFEMSLVLRLMILLSITNQGLSQNDFNQLKTQFLQAFGYEKIALIHKLGKLGLFDLSDSISREESKSNLLKIDLSQKLMQQFSKMKLNNYQYLLKRLNIIPNDAVPSKTKNSDMSYLFNGNYRPIICKYIEQILFADRSTPQKIREFEEMTKLFQGDYENIMRASSARSTNVDRNASRTVLVYFLGGCSYTEIAALKLLAKQKDYRFYFATTGFVNIKSFLNTLEDDGSK